MRKNFNNIKNKWNKFCYNPESIKAVTYISCFVWLVFLLWITQKNLKFFYKKGIRFFQIGYNKINKEV